MPVITNAIKQYKHPHIVSDPKIPIGKSLLGFFVSSANVATVSKPTNAKNTIEAPERIPRNPNSGGTNGFQFSSSTLVLPVISTKTTESNAALVTAILNFAVSFMPTTSNTVKTPTNKNA